MIINLNKLCEIIAKKYQIPREEIFLRAWFPIPEYYYSSDLPIGKGDACTDRFFCHLSIANCQKMLGNLT